MTTEEKKIEARNTVGLVLMGSEEADVAVEMYAKSGQTCGLPKPTVTI